MLFLESVIWYIFNPTDIEGEKQSIEMGWEFKLKCGVEGLIFFERINTISLVEKLEAKKEAVKILKNIEEIKS